MLAISGRWGVGKTYTLKSLVGDYKGPGSLKRFCYVSAFGAQSIAELRSTIFAKTRPFPILTGEAGDAISEVERTLGKGRLGALWRGLKGMSEALPYGGKHVVIALETIVTSLINRTLICIDDLERLSSAIRIEDLMGLVSELKEESQCKIVLLFNEEQLGDRAKEYQKASEKVVDKTLTFITMSEDAIEIGLPPNTPLRNHVASCLVKLDICNVRTVQKTAHALRMIYPVIKDYSAAVQKQAAVAIAIFAGSLYEQMAGFPDPDLVTQYNYFTDRMLERDDAEFGGAIKKKWKIRFERCGFNACDEFDSAILTILRNGYVDGSDIRTHADELDAVAHRDELNATFSAAWDLFHNRIDVTADELAAAFVAAVHQAAVVISPVNLNSTIKLLRELGFDNQANEIIESYVQQRKGTPAVFDIDHQSRMGEVDDPAFRARCLEMLEKTESLLTLQTAADIIIANETWDDAIVPTLRRATADQLVDLLKANQGAGLYRLVTGILQASAPVEDRAVIWDKMKQALTAIAEDSPINKMRAKRWGVDLTPAQQRSI
ncbi:hypothetical protein PQR14_36070 [Paraburkholderia bryophila]